MSSTEAVRAHRARIGKDKVRERGREQMRKYRAANPHAHIASNHRISMAQAKFLYELQARCAICDDPDRGVMFDHDHATGKFRGFLCQACNSGLGVFRDDIELMEKAIKYLRDRS